jgi:L-seryl-tRNA(Ser) seleniumtransferase
MTELRNLPSVDRLLRHEKATELIRDFGRPLALDAIRETLETIRSETILNNDQLSDEVILGRAGSLIHDWTFQSLRPVINATGVILHTNLGRAPLITDPHSSQITNGYSTLEYDLAEGERGTRSQHVEKYLTRLTGAEAAYVVNNNAAAVLLVLSALCKRKRVIISRSQLVEIGGGFRVPDVLAQSGAKMVEVGTTNRVHPGDYQQAFQTEAGAILRAHPSNYRVTGFTSEPSLEELAEIAHGNNALLIDDLGSGALLDTAQFGLAHEPMVQESLAAGADLVCFSGDKLLGGPQAGIILGKRDLIAKISKHPLARAVRIDKLCLTVLCRTLDLYLRDRAMEIPVWAMISLTVAELDERATRWRKSISSGEVIDGLSTVGGGSLPGVSLPTRLLAIRVKSPKKALAALRNGTLPIIARIEQDRILFDPRTVFPEEEKTFLDGLQKVFRE